MHQKIVWAILAALLTMLPEATFADSFPPLPEALDALTSDNTITFRETRVPLAFFNPTLYVFQPTTVSPEKGLILYPGGMVDPRSYAPTARAIAAQGYLVAIVSMPFDLAPFCPYRASRVQWLFPDIQKWAIGGHSVGGAYACKYAKDRSRRVAGVVIWASFPSETFRLDATPVRVICIYGTNNPNCNADEIEANKPFLPPDTVYVEIEGANHTQFGYYDTSPDPIQPGDDFAAISRQQQQEIIIAHTVSFLQGLQ